MRLYISVILTIGILIACKSGKKPQQIETQQAIQGKQIYYKYCLSCHQADGSGVPGMYPSLKKSEIIPKDPDSLIAILLHGLSGEIEVDGIVYNSVMPPHNYLTDQEIADVLTYIRSEIAGNSASVSSEDVKNVRNREPTK